MSELSTVLVEFYFLLDTLGAQSSHILSNNFPLFHLVMLSSARL